MPLGRFYKRFGTHWHSIAWYTDDLAEIWQRCTDSGVRVFGQGGRVLDQPPTDGIVVTHPKDTNAQLEFQPLAGTPLVEHDLRLQPGWDPDWWVTNHPLGLRRLAYTTVLVRDLNRAKHVWVDIIGGVLLHENFSELTGTSNAYLLVGDTVVELATPTRDGTLAAADMAANGEIHHAAAFRVVDLERAERYLAAKGIKVADRDETTLLTDPTTTHGAPFRWTTAAIPGDPQG
jgi:catechol 2,3-dioxygenase-like lactoylglutathione lyase family enzyme